MRFWIAPLLFFFGSLAIGETYSMGMLVFGHDDSMDTVIHVADGRDIEGQIFRVVPSKVTGTFCTLFVLNAVNLACLPVFGGVPLTPLETLPVSVVGGYAMRFGFGRYGSPRFEQTREPGQILRPNDVHYRLVFTHPGDLDNVRRLLARNPYLEAKQTFDTYRASRLELVARLGDRHAHEGPAEQGFKPTDRWYTRVLLIDRVQVRATNTLTQTTGLYDLSALVLGKSCHPWLLRMARLFF